MCRTQKYYTYVEFGKNCVTCDGVDRAVPHYGGEARFHHAWILNQPQ